MMERVRKEHLNWLYQEKARLEKVNDDLLEEIHKHARRETELGENLEKMMNYTMVCFYLIICWGDFFIRPFFKKLERNIV